MGDRLNVKRLFESTLGASNPQISNSSQEAKRVVQHRRLFRSGLDLNVVTTGQPNVILDILSTTQLDGPAQVESFEVCPSANVTNNTTNYVVLTLWKRDTAGANKTTIAEINTANLAATAVSFAPMVANLLSNATYAANNTILAGTVFGLDAAAAQGSGQAGLDDCAVLVTLRCD